MAAGSRMEDGSLDITQSIEDDPLLDAQLLPHHSLQAHFRPRFHPLPTVIIVNLLWFIHLVFVILAFLTGVLCSYPNPNEDKCPGNYTNPLKVQTVIILGKVILWILHLLLECYIQYHHSKIRNRGYNLIYRSTRHLKRLALMIQSSGNTVLLLILCMQHSFPEPGRLYLDLILAILALELICSLICLLIYTVKIQRFNKAKPEPDILEEEKIYAYPSNITSETGFRFVYLTFSLAISISSWMSANLTCPTQSPLPTQIQPSPHPILGSSIAIQQVAQARKLASSLTPVSFTP
ncbi:PREDICTED: transmembrane protein 192, partial [Rhinopithecus bieti]